MATRDVPGAICFNVSRILPMAEASIFANPVMLPPGRARLSIYPSPTASEEPGMMIGIVRVNCIKTGMTRAPIATIASGFNSTRLAALARTKFISSVVQRSSISMLPPRVHPSLWSSSRNAPTRDCDIASLGGYGIKIPIRRSRGGCCAPRDELSALDHSITSSARTNNVSGIVRPSALAVFKLMAISTFVACCTGRSAGFSPLRMRPV
jgi:hypothetical protein